MTGRSRRAPDRKFCQLFAKRNGKQMVEVRQRRLCNTPQTADINIPNEFFLSLLFRSSACVASASASHNNNNGRNAREPVNIVIVVTEYKPIILLVISNHDYRRVAMKIVFENSSKCNFNISQKRNPRVMRVTQCHTTHHNITYAFNFQYIHFRSYFLPSILLNAVNKNNKNVWFRRDSVPINVSFHFFLFLSLR